MPNISKSKVINRPCYSQFGGKDYGEICPPYFGWLIKLVLHPLICGCMDSLMINFVKSLWAPCHTLVDLFVALNIARFAMAIKVKQLLVSYNFLDKVIVYDTPLGLSNDIMDKNTYQFPIF